MTGAAARIDAGVVARTFGRALLLTCLCGAASVGCTGPETAPAPPANDADAGDGGSGLPDVTRLAFVRTDQGPRTLVAGTAPGNDLSHVEITFLDADGEPVAVDMNSDGTPDNYLFEIQGTGRARDGEFFLTLQSATGFEQGVAGISAKAVNSAGDSGASQLASLSDPILRPLGSPCDVRGFELCVTGSVCVASTAGTTSCRSAADLRRAACAGAERLNAFSGTTRVIGSTKQQRLYDPPLGCVSESARPDLDAVVNLRLSRTARSLTLTTRDDRTNFDTVLYLLKSCLDDTSVLACNDDAPGPSSTITLSNLPPGDYTVVIDSLTDAGGNYALSVNAQ